MSPPAPLGLATSNRKGGGVTEARSWLRMKLNSDVISRVPRCSVRGHLEVKLKVEAVSFRQLQPTHDGSTFFLIEGKTATMQVFWGQCAVLGDAEENAPEVVEATLLDADRQRRGRTRRWSAVQTELDHHSAGNDEAQDRHGQAGRQGGEVDAPHAAMCFRGQGVSAWVVRLCRQDAVDGDKKIPR